MTSVPRALRVPARLSGWGAGRHAQGARSARRAGAAALAGGVLLGIAVVGITPAPAAADPASSGTLDWGVKESFRDYVEGPVGQGAITMIHPAERRDDGTFRFFGGVGEVDADGGSA